MASLLLVLTIPLLAQAPPPVVVQENFQSYDKNVNPPGWVDSSVGIPDRDAKGLWKTRIDPTEGNKGTNIVYGTNQSSGNPDGNNSRIGTFSTLTTATFDGEGRFEFRGRMIRTTDAARIGVAFFSGYPEIDRYYLIGLWSHSGTSELTMQLFRFGAEDSPSAGGGTRHGRVHAVRRPENEVDASAAGAEDPVGVIDSGFTLPPGQWVRFLVQVDDVDVATHIRARFWPDGEPEPDSFQIDAHDSSTGRLTRGRIGLWAAVRGDAYFDELFAKSPIDTTAPAIAFRESGEAFVDGTKLGRDAIPEIVVTDDLDASPSYSAMLDGIPYGSLTPVTSEGTHTITVEARDSVGNTSSAQISFLIDKTAPVIALYEGEALFPTGGPYGRPYFNRDVLPSLTIEDISATTIAATLDGAPYVFTSRAGIATEGDHTLAITVTDAVGWSTSIGPFDFTIDKTPPVVMFVSHADGDALSTPRIALAGTLEDSATLTINGLPAIVDGASGTFAFPDFTLLEGANTLAATGVDRAGNSGSATIHLTLDTRAPELSIISPATGACLDATTIVVSGVVRDAGGTGVRVEGRGAGESVRTVDAIVDPSTGSFTANLDSVDEGQHRIAIIATDTLGHTASSSVTITVDRTAPVIEVTEGGAPFGATTLNRAVSLFVRAIDADPGVVVTTTLDGQPWTSGSTIDDEGEHTLEIDAGDCAGHTVSRSLAFTIDRATPVIREITPDDGSTLGTIPGAVSGRTDPDVGEVELRATDGTIFAPVNTDGTFALAGVPFAEGLNRFTIRLTDRAGNRAEIPYRVTIRTEAPAVEILENGTVIVDGTLFNRVIHPTFRASDGSATVTATLDGAVFTAGSAVITEGAHTLVATATDNLGHVATTTVHFTIDTTAPVVTITSPTAGTVDAEDVDVTGSAGDSVAVNVNGVAAVLAPGGDFSATVPLELGENRIVAAGRDAAGNSGRAQVDVSRGGAGSGIVVTSPVDGTLTNRRTTIVSGRVITPGAVATVRIEGRGASGEVAGPYDVAPDAAGQFTLRDLALFEGENTISVTGTATASKGSDISSPPAAHSSSLSVHVNADLTAPSLTILADGDPLEDSARFPTVTTLTIDASDAPSSLAPHTSALFVDGTRSTPPTAVSSVGGHTALAIATDAAGNQRRVERTFFIGETSSTPIECSVTDLDPASGSVVSGTSTHIAGRTSAPTVSINGEMVSVADGSFCATVGLPVEGDNAITLTCASATGEPIGLPTTITLKRVSGTPSITIDSPADGAVVVSDVVSVGGTVSADAVDVTVNGAAADLSAPGAYTADGVRLSAGLNIIAVRARNSAMRGAIATRRVVLRKGMPSIAITSPVGVPETGASMVDIRGTWANLDPTTLSAQGLGVGSWELESDTSGRFVIRDVLLQAGTNVITITGSDSLGRQTSATATVTRTEGKPSIRIDDPQDNAVFGAGADDSVTVTGTATAAAGSTVVVNGVPATLDPSFQFPAASSFSATVPFSALAATPIVARVTEPGGASTTDVIKVTKLSNAPAVHETFPADGAVAVDPAALVLVSFTSSMDVASLDGAFSLVDGSGAAVSGTTLLDRDVLSFAPVTALRDGERYTVRVTTAAKDLGGEPLASDFTASFMVATTAPSAAPTINLVTPGCGATFEVTGSAPLGARVRIDSGSFTLFTNANANGAYRFVLPFTGRSGYQLVRVRALGADGSLSPAAEQCVRFSCAGTRVVAARFDRATNALTVDFSAAIDASSITFGETGTILIRLQDGRTIGGTVPTASLPVSITITPAEDLSTSSFDLTVTTGVLDANASPLAASYTQSFSVSGDEPVPGDGSGLVSGEVLSGTTGRPLDGVTVEVTDPVSAYSTKDPKKEGPK